jgi:hypothetical protein
MWAIYVSPLSVSGLTANSQPCWQCVIRSSAAVNNKCGGLSSDDLALCRASRLGGRRVSRGHSTGINRTPTTSGQVVIVNNDIIITGLRSYFAPPLTRLWHNTVFWGHRHAYWLS